jgi:hypothetical protein
MKRAVVYMRVSTVDQHPETQLHDLRKNICVHFYPSLLPGRSSRVDNLFCTWERCCSYLRSPCLPQRLKEL